MSKKKKSYFQKSYLDQEQHKDWLAEVPEDTNVNCKLCNKVLSQSTTDTNIIFNSVIKAEIIWSLFSVCEGFSNNSAKYLNQTFQSMFSECPTAQKFQFGPRSP